MKSIHLEHEIACDEKTFWDAFLDRDYTEKLFREVLGFPSFEILAQKDVDDGVERECAAQPKLPAAQMALARLLRRRGFHFIERAKFDKGARVFTWVLEPNVWATLLVNRGKVRTNALESGRTQRIVDIELEARIPGLGGVIEGSAVKRMEDGWNASATFMNDWIVSRSKQRS